MKYAVHLMVGYMYMYGHGHIANLRTASIQIFALKTHSLTHAHTLYGSSSEKN